MKAQAENSVVIASPCHGRRVRVPTDRGALDVRCPCCPRSWRWSPPGAVVAAPRPRGDTAHAQDNQPQQPRHVPARHHDGEVVPAPRHEHHDDHHEHQPRQSLVATIKEKFGLVLPEWFAAPHGFGQMIPRVDTTPDVAELHVLDVVCSHTRRPFRQTFAKTRLGEPFRLVDNGDAKSYLRLARAHGSRITKGVAGSILVNDFDWSNWQCQHCGHGEVAGDVQNFFLCHCGAMNCASSVRYPRNAQASFLCGSCGATGVLTEIVDTLASKKRMAYNDRDRDRDRDKD